MKNQESNNVDAVEPKALEHPSYEELENQLTNTELKVAEYHEKILRLQADMENVRKRSERDVSHAYKYSLEKIVRALLPVIDNLERSLGVDVVGAEALREGIELTLKMFQDALAKFEVEQIYPENEPFDPALHEAMTTEVRTDVSAGIVVNVLQKGYKLNDRLLRPALVIVSKEA